VKRLVQIKHAYYSDTDKNLILHFLYAGNEGPEEILCDSPGGEHQYYRQAIIPANSFTCNSGDFAEEMHKTAAMFVGRNIYLEIPDQPDGSPAPMVRIGINDQMSEQNRKQDKDVL
jgi:hypothetical protein